MLYFLLLNRILFFSFRIRSPLKLNRIEIYTPSCKHFVIIARRESLAPATYYDCDTLVRGLLPSSSIPLHTHTSTYIYADLKTAWQRNLLSRCVIFAQNWASTPQPTLPRFAEISLYYTQLYKKDSSQMYSETRVLDRDIKTQLKIYSTWYSRRIPHFRTQRSVSHSAIFIFHTRAAGKTGTIVKIIITLEK